MKYLICMLGIGALFRLYGAVACELQVEAVCESNGAGVHCHPCLATAYIECVSAQQGIIHSCPEGFVWDARGSQCVAAGSNPSPCLAGVNINAQQAVISQPPSHVARGSSVVQSGNAQQLQQQNWVDWATGSLSSVVSSATAATAELIEAVPAALNVLLPKKEPLGSAASSLRSQMLGAPTVQQLQQLQANLAKAADMHSHAVSMSQDATLAETVAAKDLAAAKTLLLGPAMSSSDQVEIAAAVKEAKQLIKRAAAALKTADDMRLAADDLMSESAAEAAGVSSAVSAANQQQQQQPLHRSRSTAYAPTFIGRIASGDAAEDSVSSLGMSEYDYLDDGVDDGYDSDMVEPLPMPISKFMPYWPSFDGDAVRYQSDYSYLDGGYDGYGDTYDDMYDDGLEFSEEDASSQSLESVLQERTALLAQLRALQSSRMVGGWGSDYHKYRIQVTKGGGSDSGSGSDSSDEFVDLFSDDGLDGEQQSGNNSASANSRSSSRSSHGQATGTTGIAEFQDAQLLNDLNTAILQLEHQQQQQQQQSSRQQQQQQQQQEEGGPEITEPAGLMLPEVVQRWQQRSRKGMNGRSQIRAAAAANVVAVAKRRRT